MAQPHWNSLATIAKVDISSNLQKIKASEQRINDVEQDPTRSDDRVAEIEKFEKKSIASQNQQIKTSIISGLKQSFHSPNIEKYAQSLLGKSDRHFSIEDKTLYKRMENLRVLDRLGARDLGEEAVQYYSTDDKMKYKSEYIREEEAHSRQDAAIDFAVTELNKLDDINLSANRVLVASFNIANQRPRSDIQPNSSDHQSLIDGIDAKLGKDSTLATEYKDLLQNALENKKLVSEQKATILADAEKIKTGKITANKAQTQELEKERETTLKLNHKEMSDRLYAAEGQYTEAAKKHSKEARKGKNPKQAALRKMVSGIKQIFKRNKASAGKQTSAGQAGPGASKQQGHGR